MSDNSPQKHDTTIDKVANTIFVSCDVKNEGLVSVSLLLDYLKPFLQMNMDQLNTLGLELDPEGTGQRVTKGQLTKALTKWSDNIKGESFAEIDASHLPAMDDEKMLYQSTPRPSIDFNPNHQFIRLDISNINTFDSNKTVEQLNGSVMEEKVKDFQYQLSKTTTELETIKEQLGTAEIQNETLVIEINELKKNLLHEKLLNKELLTYKTDCEDFKVEATILKDQNDQLKARLSNVDKENLKLRGEINNLEDKVYASQLTNSALLKTEQDLRKLMADLRNEIDLKDARITGLEKITEQMNRNLQEQCELVVFYRNENDLMKHKVQSMDKLCEQTIEDSLSFKFKSQNGCDSLKPDETRIITPPTNLRKMVLGRNLPSKTSTPLNHSEEYQNTSCPPLVSPISATPQELKTSNKSFDSPPAIYVMYQSGGDDAVTQSNRNGTTNGNQTTKNLHQELCEGMKTTFYATCNSCRGDDCSHSHSQLKCSRFLKGGDLRLELQEQEEIKNSLWNALQDVRKEMQRALREKDTVIEQLRRELDEEKRVILELRQEISGEISKSISQNEIILKSERSLVRITRELDETKAHEKFLDESRQSLQQLWNEKRDLLTRIDQRLVDIHEKLGEKLNSITISYKHDRKVFGKLETGRKIEDLGTMIDLLMGHIYSLSRSGSSSRTQSFERQEVRIAKLEKKAEHYRDLLSAEQARTGSLTAERDSLLSENTKLEQRLAKCEDITFLQDESRLLLEEVATLKKEKGDLMEVNDFQRLFMKAELETCRKAMIDLEGEVCAFLESCNSNLQSVIYNVVNRVRSLFGDDSVQEVNDNMAQIAEKTDFDNIANRAKYWLLQNIKLVSLIFETLLNKSSSEILNLSNGRMQLSMDKLTTESESHSFVSCSSNNSSFLDLVEEIPAQDCFPTFSDDFLENLGIGDEIVDLESLTLQELQDKFAALALTWTVDFKTFEGRMERQKLHHRTRLSKYSKSLQFLSRNSQPKFSERLFVLQREADDALASAEQLGRLSLEKRTMNCWKLVTGYVATLRQSVQQLELKARARLNPVLSTTVQNQSYDGDLMSTSSSRWSFWFLLLLLVFLVILGMIHNQCRKLGEAFECPLDYLFDSIFKKVKGPFVTY